MRVGTWVVGMRVGTWVAFAVEQLLNQLAPIPPVPRGAPIHNISVPKGARFALCPEHGSDLVPTSTPVVAGR